MKKLKQSPLTPENFKEYGFVLNVARQEPAADNPDFKYWSEISQLQMGRVASTGLLYGNMREPVATRLERHVNTPEVLVSVEGDSILCVGKPTGAGVNIEDVAAFYLKQGDAVALREGTWHAVPFPVNDAICKFIVMFALGTEDNDLELSDLPEEIRIFN